MTAANSVILNFAIPLPVLHNKRPHSESFHFEQHRRLQRLGRLEDETKVRFTVSVTDNGSPILDMISISLDNGYSASGTLTSGDIRIY